jgi:glycosyltransferase involved in cell wall biosynthesis
MPGCRRSSIMPPDILIFAPTAAGGLAEHVFYQARALQRAGADVLCLASREYLGGRVCPFPIRRVLAVPPPVGGSRWVRRTRHLAVTLANQFRLAWWVAKRRPRLVLLDSYIEYLSPLWIWPHVLLARCLGVRYAANLHDPVRDFQLGPAWWHRLSVRLAYVPLDSVLVHGRLPEPSPVPSSVRVFQVPVGVYDLPGPSRSRESVRSEWGAQSQHRVFLAAGYVRDGKNLDLVIRALCSVPDAFLVMAGTLQSGTEEPFAFYRQLASDLGVADRVHFHEGFIPDVEMGDYFAGSDFVVLTYSSAFHSQSGVLNIAVRARKPVLASASPGPLLESVNRFGLGVTIQPDNVEGIVEGMRQLLEGRLQPRWEAYEAYADWDANARGILEAAGLGLSARTKALA